MMLLLPTLVYVTSINSPAIVHEAGNYIIAGACLAVASAGNTFNINNLTTIRCYMPRKLYQSQANVLESDIFCKIFFQNYSVFTVFCLNILNSTQRLGGAVSSELVHQL